MAVGMATTEGLPRCPEDCGGPLGAEYPNLLTKEQRALRERWGCDCAAPEPMFTITCPRCDGSRIAPDGTRCTVCKRGMKEIRRCPTSHIDPALSDALRHYPHAEGGAFPESGGLMEQHPSYINFVSVLGGECARIRKEEHDDMMAKSKSRSKK